MSCRKPRRRRPLRGSRRAGREKLRTAQKPRGSQKRKKTKTKKKGRKEGRKRRKEIKAAEGDKEIKPNLKTGRFGDTGASGLNPTQLFEGYVHKYRKKIS